MRHKLLKGSQLRAGMIVTVVEIRSKSIVIQSGIIQSKEGSPCPSLDLYSCYNEQLNEEFTFTWWNDDVVSEEEIDGESTTSAVFEGLPY